MISLVIMCQKNQRKKKVREDKMFLLDQKVMQKKDNEMDKKLRDIIGLNNVLQKSEEYKKKGMRVPKRPRPKKEK